MDCKNIADRLVKIRDDARELGLDSLAYQLDGAILIAAADYRPAPAIYTLTPSAVNRRKTNPPEA